MVQRNNCSSKRYLGSVDVYYVADGRHEHTSHQNEEGQQETCGANIQQEDKDCA